MRKNSTVLSFVFGSDKSLTFPLSHAYLCFLSSLFVVFFFKTGPPRATAEKPKGPSRRSSRAEKEVEEEPVVDSGTRKRSARPGTTVKGVCQPNTSLSSKGKTSVFFQIFVSKKHILHFSLLLNTSSFPTETGASPTQAKRRKSK